MATEKYDTIIVGAGLAGLTATVILAQRAPTTAKIALIAPRVTTVDRRTTALLASSIKILDDAGIWQKCANQSAPLATMRIIDGTKRLFRAPVVSFRAGELDLEAFGYNIANVTLAGQLLATIKQFGNVVVIPQSVVSSVQNSEMNTLTLENGDEINSSLIIAADGRKSMLRTSAGISIKEWSYPQWAVVLNFVHTLPHGNISTEFHTESGPFTQVPLPPLEDQPHRSSLVWVERKERAEQISKYPADELAKQVENRMQSMLGKVTIESIEGEKPQIFPLSGMSANEMGANRIALVGEAAHVIPPIGAQGFNLGLRDVEAICDLAAAALCNGNDPGDVSLLKTYGNLRRNDIVSRTAAVDLLNRSLLSSFLPVQAVRTGGLYALSRFSWLRRKAMRSGVAG